MTRPARPLLILALAGLALGACTARDAARGPSAGPRYASLDASLDGPRPAASAPAQAATPVAVLPAWIGRPARLRERDEPDAFEQVVTLTLAPRGETRENVVMLRRPRAGRAAEPDGASPEPGGRPSEAGIRAELAAAFPGTPMQVVTRPARNAYGPYGLAVGRAARGARCLYAWQWIEEAPDLDPSAGGSSPLSLRVRLCRDDVTLEAMAAAVNQIKLVPRFAGAAVEPASRGPSAAARTRARIRAAAARPRDAGITGTAAGTVARVDRPERAGTERARADETAAAASGRRYLGAADAAGASPDDGRAVRDAGPGPAAMSRAFGAAMPAQAALAADLPPEALRGPVARPAGRP